MATSTVVPVSEYLSTIYHPDCDYVDGEIQERNLGEKDHSKLQRHLVRLLSTYEREEFVDAYPELRVQVSATRFRVPDVAVLSPNAPEEEQIVLTPPLLCIEVLSPKDTLARTCTRAMDFILMGVPEVWVADPATRTLYICTEQSTTKYLGERLTVPGTPVTLELAEIFAVLNRRR